MKRHISRWIICLGCVWAAGAMQDGWSQETDPFSATDPGEPIRATGFGSMGSSRSPAQNPYGAGTGYGGAGGYGGGAYGGGGYGGGFSSGYSSGFSGAVRTVEPALEFVLFTSELRDRVGSSLADELRIMAHILGKRLDQVELQYRGRVAASGLPIALNWEDRPGVRVQYIEGYGAVFCMAACFPLAASEQGASAGADAATQGGYGAESEWTQAQREVMGTGMPSQESGILMRFDRQSPDLLQNQLLDALKNARNLGLQENEVLVVQVEGPARAMTAQPDAMYGPGMGGGMGMGEMGMGGGGMGMMSGMGAMPPGMPNQGSNPSSVMVLRVPFSRVMQWGKDSGSGLSPEKIAEDVEVWRYIRAW